MTRITFQISHSTDSDANSERDYIINELRQSGVIGDVTLYQSGPQLITEHFNHYTTDGEVAVATLAYLADYGESGIMTFIVNQRGKVYQMNLGQKTTKLAKAMRTYDSDPTWQVAP